MDKWCTTRGSSTCPPAVKLSAQLDLNLDTAKKLRAAIKEGYELERGHYSHSVVEFMERIGKIADFHYGVESLYPEKPHIFYLNAGDTYATTLIFNYEQDRFTLGCWGDLVGE